MKGDGVAMRLHEVTQSGRGLERMSNYIVGIPCLLILDRFIHLSSFSWTFIIFNPQMSTWKTSVFKGMKMSLEPWSSCRINMLLFVSNTALVIFPSQKCKGTNQKRARTIHVIKRSKLRWPMFKLCESGMGFELWCI